MHGEELRQLLFQLLRDAVAGSMHCMCQQARARGGHT